MIHFGLFGIALQFYDHRYAKNSSKVRFKVPIAKNVNLSSFEIEDYRKIIGVFQNIDNRYRLAVELEISEKISVIFLEAYRTALLSVPLPECL